MLEISVTLKTFEGEEYLLAVARNITQRKQAEIELNKSKRFIERIANAIPSILYVNEFPQFRNIYVNSQLTSLLGYTREQIQEGGNLLTDLVLHPDDIINLRRNTIRILRAKDGEVVDNIYRVRHANGEWRWFHSREVVFSRNFDRSVKQYIGVASDITERKRTEEALKASAWEKDVLNQVIISASQAQDLPTLMKNIMNSVLQLLDFDCGCIYLVSKKEKIARLKYNVNFPEVLIDRKREIRLDDPLYDNVLIRGNAWFTDDFDQRVQTEDGDKLLAFASIPIFLGQKIIGALNIASYKRVHFTETEKNISQFIGRQIGSVIAKTQAEDRIKASLQEKEVLLKEIHHRVKNNLQIISSLLNLQSASINDQQLLEMFKEIQNRVKTMALIHQRLYQSANLSKIDFSEYAPKLIQDLFHSYQLSDQQIKLNMNVKDILLNIETAIPCGLIINEVISNCLKHAFPNGNKGKIMVEFLNRQSHFTLSICDNGVGLPARFTLEDADTVGLSLVKGLTHQLEGELSVESRKKRGTTFNITFKELEVN